MDLILSLDVTRLQLTLFSCQSSPTWWRGGNTDGLSWSLKLAGLSTICLRIGQLDHFTSFSRNIRTSVCCLFFFYLDIHALTSRNGRCRSSQQLAGAVVVPSEEDGQTFSVNFASGEVNIFLWTCLSFEVGGLSLLLLSHPLILIRCSSWGPVTQRSARFGWIVSALVRTGTTW